MYLQLDILADQVVSLTDELFDLDKQIQLTVKGSSMLPFIRNGAKVIIRKPSIPKLGDVVLCQIANKHYAFHRIIMIRDGRIWLRGDANYRGEGPFPLSYIKAKAVQIKHGCFWYNYSTGLFYVLGRIWIAFFPVGVAILRFVFWVRKLSFHGKMETLSL